ncbi:hypothetical protein GLOIN_2v1658163, partial [Rhizophagus irregularis DAOM 181602=DAOM 197198]
YKNSRSSKHFNFDINDKSIYLKSRLSSISSFKVSDRNSNPKLNEIFSQLLIYINILFKG